MIMTARNLPITDILGDVSATLANHNRLIVQAPPGAGKTTLLPLHLLKEDWVKERKILMLEPRRIAARSAARQMASLLGEKVGQTVGYRIQMDQKVGPNTRLEILTEGILTRRLQHDPELEGVSAIIFDEFHERSLQADLGLALTLDSQEGLREDLKLIIMSATLDGEALSQMLDHAHIVTSDGRSYPVTSKYLGPPDRFPNGRVNLIPDTVKAIKTALREETGSILTFLPGEGEIRKVASELSSLNLPDNILVAPLFGAMSQKEQDKAIQPVESGMRKIVLATNIAETSLTIQGIRIVIDCGYERKARYNPNNGLTFLETRQISLASATQRQGRAGRIEEGVCYRLWDEAAEGGMQSHSKPEILDADLSGLALDLANWGIQDSKQLTWLDIPNPALFAQGRDLLRKLNALDENHRITDHGKALAKMPMHPRLAHMIVTSQKYGQLRLACDLAAILSERDFMQSRRQCNLSLRLDDLSRNPAAKRQKALADNWFKRFKQTETKTSALPDINEESLTGLLLSLVFPDRVALKRPNDPTRYQMANGRGAILDELDQLSGAECLCIADLTGDRSDSFIRLAAAINLDDLKSFYIDLLEEGSFAVWDKRSQSIKARHQLRLGRLILADKPADDIPEDQIESAIYDGIGQNGLKGLLIDKEATALLNRMRLAHKLSPTDWPNMSEAALLKTMEDWLSPYLTQGPLAKVRKLSDLKYLNMTQIFLAQLDWNQQQALDKFIPERWQVPSGSRIRIDYSNLDAPVLAVKLQEMFGATETPTIANGKLPLTLHLLSPAQRPLQITQNLISFWEDSYHLVKADMKGRYPKHPWPDDPMNHIATAKTKNRM